MYKVGMTGGIAVGKSTVANVFSQFGVQVIDSDVLVHQLMAGGTLISARIAKRFGKSVRRDDGSINRDQLRAVIHQPEQLHWLEKLIHPHVRANMLAAIEKRQCGYCILVVPLLFETSFHTLVNTTLLVDIEEQLQRQRALVRTGMKEQELNVLLARQCNREQRLAKADAVISGNLSPGRLKLKVQELDSRYRQTALAT